MSNDFKQKFVPFLVSFILALGILLVIFQVDLSAHFVSSAAQTSPDQRLAYVILVIPLILITAGLYQLALIYRYTHYGVSTQGTITAISSREPFTLHNYARVTLCKPTISFTDQAGQQHVFVNRYESPFLTPHHVGTMIEVLYLPNQPENVLAMNKKWRRGPFATLTIGLGFLLVFGAALAKL